MYCVKCGKEIENNVLFCPYCGEMVASGKTDSAKNRKVEENIAKVISGGGKVLERVKEILSAAVLYVKKRKTQFVLGGSALICAVAVFLIATLIISNRKTVIHPDKYFEISFTGYEGYGEHEFKLNKRSFMADYEDKIKWPKNYSKRVDRIIDKYDLGCSEIDFTDLLESKYGRNTSACEMLYNAIFGNIYVDDSYGLENGDVFYVDCQADSEMDYLYYDDFGVNVRDADFYRIVGDLLDVRIAETHFEYEVSGLKTVSTFDAFEGIDIVYEGASPKARPHLNVEEKNDIMYYIYEEGTVREGDKLNVIASIPCVREEDYVNKYGKLPETTSKEFTVKDLPEYVTTASDIPDEVLSEMKAQSEDVIKGSTYGWIEGFTLTPTYIGNYLLTAKDADPDVQNMLVLIYKLHYSNSFVDYTGESREYGMDYYYYVAWNNIIRNQDGAFSYDLSDYQKPDSKFKTYTNVFKKCSKYRGAYDEYELSFTGCSSREQIYDLFVTANIEKYRLEDNTEVNN